MAVPMTRMAVGPGRRLLAPVGALAGVGAAFTLVALVDPNHPGHYPVCPLYGFTGIYCPGCGGLRCAHAVASGKLGTALHDNALAVVGFAAFAVFWVYWVLRARKGLPTAVRLAPKWWWAIGVAAAAFTVVRNLPFGGFMAP
ncbi:DUF2752 domain-containing protein [Streptomyces bomunensis]|uniref:DUF2752 domain-containing protein n=2 Tax=Streptomyces montanisoli TaxID=2798581 RepID=A0A940RYZ3_9ACTN|nr:DUF2752 domain-containing protein [Streptomyces montanisoli]